MGVLSLVGLFAQFLILGRLHFAAVLRWSRRHSFAPVFLALLTLRSTAHIGARYIMGTVGILAWPLGWAAASIGTSNLIDVATARLGDAHECL